ncbi:MAG: hypothetical protein R3F11_19640 [Verrucomicrobiales bacterium]
MTAAFQILSIGFLLSAATSMAYHAAAWCAYARLIKEIYAKNPGIWRKVGAPLGFWWKPAGHRRPLGHSPANGYLFWSLISHQDLGISLPVDPKLIDAMRGRHRSGMILGGIGALCLAGLVGLVIAEFA